MRRSSRTVRRLTVSAILTALSVVMLWLSSVMPSGQLGFVAVASLFTAAAVIECGVPYAFGVFAASGILGFLLLPVKNVLLLYVLFFGYYPIVKCFAERIKNRTAGWALKIALAAAAACVLWFVFGRLLFSENVLAYTSAVVIVAAVVVFVVYDIGLSKLITYYTARISRRGKNSF